MASQPAQGGATLGSTAPALPKSLRRKLAALQGAAQEFAKQRGAYDELFFDAMIALLGEGAAAPRRSRSWARPEWCSGQCPGCGRMLRLLCVPNFDVVQCVYC